MKVKEFIEYLKTLDQEATVQVLNAYPSGSWDGGSCISKVVFDPKEHVDELDARDEGYAKYPNIFGLHEYTFGLEE